MLTKSDCVTRIEAMDYDTRFRKRQGKVVNMMFVNRKNIEKKFHGKVCVV